MTTNTFITNDDICEHALGHFINELQYTMLANRYYESEFKSVNGFERGTSVRILKPTYMIPRQGVTANPQGIQERYTSINLSYQDGQDIAISSLQLTTSIDDISKRVLRPIAIGLANLVDTRVATEVALSAYNAIGSASSPMNSFAAFRNQKKALRKRGVRGEYMEIFNEDDSANMENALQNNFNTTLNEEISIRGTMGQLSGVMCYTSQNSQAHTNGVAVGTPQINGANQTGEVLITDGWTPGAILNQGDLIYISTGTPVRQVNAVSRIQTGATTDDLQRFIVTQSVTDDGAGNILIPIYPPIQTTGPYQNVTNSPSNDATVVLMGASGVAYDNNYMFTKEAISIAIVPLIIPPGAVNASVMTDPDSGISLRVIDSYDTTNDLAYKRVDVLYGIKVFPEYMERYISSGA